MASVFTRGVVGMLATAAALSPSFACGAEETWLTDEEIAIARAGGDLPIRDLGVRYIEPALPDIPFVAPVVVEGLVAPDTIVDAQSQLLAAAGQPFGVATSAVTLRAEHVASTDEQEPASPPDERSGFKRVVIACDGGMLVTPNVL